MGLIMKKRIIQKIKILILIIAGLVIFDYINLPSLLGFEMSNINWDFCMGILNIIVVIVLYLITFRTLDARTIEREINKKEVSILLIEQCYQEILDYIDWLNQETVEKIIVPKIDFNSTNNKILDNLQNSPFQNEEIIIDLAKDGQITKNLLETYLKFKVKYRKYLNMRITFYDAPHYYEPLKHDLCDAIKAEIRTLDKINI
jgi:hypothetical protein